MIAGLVAILPVYRLQSLKAMKNLIAFICLFVSLIISFSAMASPLIVSYLVLGEEKKFPLNSTRVWIEDSKIIKAQNMGGSLKVLGLAEGAPLVRIGEQPYQIYVINPKKQEALLRLKEALKTILGLKVDYSQGETQVLGQLFRMKDWQTLAQNLKGSEINYVMNVEISPELKIEAQKYFDALLLENSLAKQKLSFSEGAAIRLPLKHIFTAQYKKVLGPYGVTVSEDANSLAIEPTIRLQITVVEIQRSWSQKIGLRWPDSYQAQILPQTFFGDANTTATANFFEQSGNGKVLASPNLICRSGKEAEFVAGGEFPIKIMNYKMSDVVWKKYGIVLKVKPLADNLGQMSVQIDTDVSSIDPARTVDGIPAIITHHVSSYFDLRSARTIALSGLIKNEESQSSEGMPWLSRLPILGALFSSKDFRENRTELVIFVRPEIIDLQSEPTDLPPKHLVSRESYGN